MTNPFIERTRITRPEHFAGRWAELSLIFERLEHQRPVLLFGGPGIGKSSILTHLMQSAAATLEEPALRAYYLDLAVLADAADVYQLVTQALGERGDTSAALEVALTVANIPLLLCLDNAQHAIAAGWGEPLLDTLARMVRGHDLLLVAALEGPPPTLSERFAMVTIGAFATVEVGLLADAYLDGTGVSFAPAELRDLTVLSAAHPAYLQRAAYHLFESKRQPGYDWRAAYLQEAREQPVPGAPLPPQVFEGAAAGRFAESAYSDSDGALQHAPPTLPIPAIEPGLLLVAPLLLGLLCYLLTRNAALALLIAAASCGALLFLRSNWRKQ